MIPYGFGQHQRHGDHHWMLACVAVLLSAIIHMVLMFFFADWAISGIAGLREKGREWFDDDRVPPMRVETMRADPMRIAKKVAGERGRRGTLMRGLQKIDRIEVDSPLRPAAGDSEE